jgi:CRP/FNR family transcriptional regulator, cyclic AMP receptor protein
VAIGERGEALAAMTVHGNRPRRSEWLSVLHSDPELLARATPATRASAVGLSAARTLQREAGGWESWPLADAGSDGFGLLVVDGMLVRRLAVNGRHAVELLGVGDVLQPWVHDDDAGVLPASARWRVLSPLRLAVLDAAWVTRMGPFPEVGMAVVARLQRRSRRLARLLAIGQQRRLDDRLHLLLWELADEYGHVCGDGVDVGLRLTHELVADLVCAERPSVSTAFSRLVKDRRVRVVEQRWILPLGEHPPL